MKQTLTNKQIANNIKAERARANLTQQEVADLLGMERSNYIRYENGESNIRATMLEQLSRIFNCPIQSFFLHQ